MFARRRIPGRDELAARGLTMSPQRPDLPVNDRCYRAALRGRSALDVGELLPHEPIAEPQDVDAPNVTRRSWSRHGPQSPRLAPPAPSAGDAIRNTSLRKRDRESSAPSDGQPMPPR